MPSTPNSATVVTLSPPVYSGPSPHLAGCRPALELRVPKRTRHRKLAHHLRSSEHPIEHYGRHNPSLTVDVVVVVVVKDTLALRLP